MIDRALVASRGDASTAVVRWSSFLPILAGLLVALPLLSILVLAVKGDDSFISGSQLLAMAVTTATLSIGAGLIALVLGTVLAWLIDAYDFPGRRALRWMALLPLAIPAYITAFVYVDFLDYAGPLQTWLRSAMGWISPEDYLVPSIRSLPMAALTFALVLYPYVYLAGRTAFARLPASQVMAARTLGRKPMATFLSVVLPQARPALAVGVALVVMECLNDIGAVSFFGLRTFAIGIYSTWLDQGNLGGAARLAVMMLSVIAALVWLENWARQKDGLPKVPTMSQSLRREKLMGWRGWLATFIVVVPIALGFILPVLLLIGHGFRRFDEVAAWAFVSALINSVGLAAAAALVTLVVAVALHHVARRGRWPTALKFISNMGYAVPGTILAIGIIVPFSLFDHGLNKVSQMLFGHLPGLILSGTVFALLFAYVARFLIIASGMVESGFEKIPNSLGQAARTLGRSPFRVLIDVHLPLLRPALVAGGLLVFVDAMKELPATLLLRPFDFETLATLTFSSASLGLIEQAAMPALAIVAAGLIPIAILTASLHGNR